MTQFPANTTILQITPQLDAGGVERTTVDIAKAIVAAGGRALVASEGGRLEEELLAAGAELIRLPVASKNPFVIASNTGKLVELIERENVSLLHVRSRAPAFSAVGAARRTHRPLVSTYHGVYNASHDLKRWYNGVMTRSDVVIANSNYTRDHVIATHKVAPAKVIAIPRGVDLQRFDPAAVTLERLSAVRAQLQLDDDTAPSLLLAGRLTAWKGQSFLIGVLARLKQNGAALPHLRLAGDAQGRTAYVERLETEIALYDLGHRIKIVGHIDDMPAAYLACDLACAPSLEPEAFGRTAVEPQAMGRPILAARHGAVPETVDPEVTGWTLAPGDETAWAEGLSAALNAGPAVWRRMGEAGIERVKARYSLAQMQAATLAIYARLLTPAEGAA